jgi:hypothetical protein
LFIKNTLKIVYLAATEKAPVTDGRYHGDGYLSETEPYIIILCVYTVNRFVSISAKFGICTVVCLNGTLVESKICTVKCPQCVF